MPIPVALCGKNPSMASHFTEVMGPEYYGTVATTYYTNRCSLTKHSLPRLPQPFHRLLRAPWPSPRRDHQALFEARDQRLRRQDDRT